MRGRVTIGAGNWIYPFCTIGTGPQHSEYPEDPLADPSAADPAGPGRGEIVMGSGNTVRGYASVNLPATSGRTSVGSGCHLLAYSHVAHDCDVRDGAILSAGAILGGHTEVGAGAHLGLGTMVHPRTRIGRLSMVGLRGAVVRDVPPFALVNDGRFTRVNTVGMERAGMSAAEIKEVRRAYAEVAAARGGGVGGAPLGGRPRAGAAWRRRYASSSLDQSGDATRRASGTASIRAGALPTCRGRRAAKGGPARRRHARGIRRRAREAPPHPRRPAAGRMWRRPAVRAGCPRAAEPRAAEPRAAVFRIPAARALGRGGGARA